MRKYKSNNNEAVLQNKTASSVAKQNSVLYDAILLEFY